MFIYGCGMFPEMSAFCSLFCSRGGGEGGGCGTPLLLGGKLENQQVLEDAESFLEWSYGLLLHVL